MNILNILDTPINDLRNFFGLRQDEFTNEHFFQIKNDNPNLMIIDQERVKEIMHDENN
jgi:hypothetical protein